eukprot:g17919.t1
MGMRHLSRLLAVQAAAHFARSAEAEWHQQQQEEALELQKSGSMRAGRATPENSDDEQRTSRPKTLLERGRQQESHEAAAGARARARAEARAGAQASARQQQARAAHGRSTATGRSTAKERRQHQKQKQKQSKGMDTVASIAASIGISLVLIILLNLIFVPLFCGPYAAVWNPMKVREGKQGLCCDCNVPPKEELRRFQKEEQERKMAEGGGKKGKK